MIDRRSEPILLFRGRRHPCGESIGIHGGFEEPVVERFLAIAWRLQSTNGAAVAGGGRQPLPPLGAQSPFEELAQATHHKWRLTGRSDGDLEGTTPDPRRQMEGAELGVIGDVAPHAGLLGVAKHPRVGLPIVGGGEDKSPTVVGIRFVGTSFEIDFPAISHLGQRLNDLGRYDRDPRPLLDQTLHLAQGDTAASHDQAAAIPDLKSYGIQRPLHVPRTDVTRA